MNRQFFIDRCLVNEVTGCWEWQGCRTPSGYGQLRKWGRPRPAHRMSYIVHYGDIADGLVVMHKCDNRSCCNPDHLCAGTQAQNLQDMRLKGRHAYGEAANHILTEEQVTYIRTCTKQVKELALELGCDYETVRLARIGKTWTHLPGAWVKGDGYYHRPPEAA